MRILIKDNIRIPLYKCARTLYKFSIYFYVIKMECYAIQIIIAYNIGSNKREINKHNLNVLENIVKIKF